MIALSSPILAAYASPFHNPTFWVAVAVILFFVLLIYKGVFKALGNALDNRAEKIRTELDEAKRLREEAQALLASYQRKQKEAEEQAEQIIVKARRDCLLYTSPSPRDQRGSRMPSSA